jgi:phosphate transport system protein
VTEPEGPLRVGFAATLDSIDERVTRLFGLVIQSLVAATDSFLAADRDIARSVVGGDELIDALEREIESAVERTMLIEAPVARDFYRLLTALRVVPELERSGDLAEHIASRAAGGLGAELSPSVRGLVEQLGQEVADMWCAAADAWADRDGSAAARLIEQDERVNALHQRLWEELAGAEPPVKVAMEMALVARFYERLGDHAKHITERLPGAAPHR